MAIANKYPTIRPSLNLDFANSKTIDPRITFSRASSATYFDDKGVMRTAPAGVPRIDHDPVTGESLGLLIEEQRTNLLTYSEGFGNTSWVKINATITADAAVAPDGTMTADKFETTRAGASYAYQSTRLTQAQPYTLSVYVKYVSGVDIVWLRDFTEAGVVKFDLINGVIDEVAGIATSAAIVRVSNNWFRISAVFTPTVATANHNISCAHPGSALVGSSFFFWGAQLEQGAFPTSYIKTEASQVTRAADNAVMTGTNFSDWSNSVGTILAKYKTAGWKHNNTPPVTQLDLTKAVDDYSTPITSDGIQRAVFYPRQLTADQITALKG